MAISERMYRGAKHSPISTNVNAAIHSKLPLSKPVSKPFWARLTRCKVEISVAKSARPVLRYPRLLPARKYSSAAPRWTLCRQAATKPIATIPIRQVPAINRSVVPKFTASVVEPAVCEIPAAKRGNDVLMQSSPECRDPLS